MRLWPHLGLAGILLLALALRCWRLGPGGFITPYYLAGVRSMSGNWHNFFFNAFDPAGFVSLDKPPVAFWIQAGSVRLFGFSALTALLPQALEGGASVLVLYLLVRRVFGNAAGLLAALFLALTPIAVAVDRSNNADSCLVLTLLLATWALSLAVETGRARFLLLCALLVGIGFNVKMLVAVGIVPVFGLVYLVGAPVPLGRRFGQLAAAGAVLVAVSLSWTVAYDLTPPQIRPFVDSTRGNSMLELVVGHNGLQRFVRRAGDRGLAATATAETPNGAPLGAGVPNNTEAASAGLPPSRDYAPAGALRLAAPHLAAQMAWLLPLAVFGGMAAWWRAGKFRERLSLALWAGWAVCYGVVFSAAGGLFHAYYLVVMAPPLCALAGIGVAALGSLHATGAARSLVFPAVLVVTALWQAHIVEGYLGEYLAIGENWLVPTLIATTGLASAGLALTRPVSRKQARAFAGIGLAVLLAMPWAWSVGTVLSPGNTGFPAARPPFLTDAAEMQRGRWAQVVGALAGDPQLIAFLRENRRSEEFLLATVNARQAAPIIIATSDPVIAVGGFTGRNPILTGEAFARLVKENRLRFALVGDGSRGLRRIFGEDGQREVTDWIRENGRLIDPRSWRSADIAVEPGATRPVRAAETIGAQLYDLRPDPAAGRY